MIKMFAGCALALFVTTGPAPTVTGTWNMGLQADHVVPVALVLKQDGTRVTGTIALPTQRSGERVEVPMSGEFADGALTLSGTVEHAVQPTTIRIVGKLTEEGTLEGKATMPHGEVPFTAERLKERK
jgi:hypothetical protein